MYDTALLLLHKINSFGFISYIVGGYPRDLYLGKESIDVDICTNATPKDLKQIFEDVMLPNVQYGSVTVIINKIRFEITTFRKDIQYVNNRQPVKIKYIDSLIEDLKRRDFTINTICIDENGTVIDLLNGKKDIDDKLIKMVGNPRIKLKEDALRILRAVRFATILNFKLDNELKSWIKKYGCLLKNLSYYRKMEEVDKIFNSPNISYGIELIKELNLDEYLEFKNIDQLILTTSSVGIWAQLGVVDIYDFNSNIKTTINKVNELMDKDLLDDYVLYLYGPYYTTICGEIRGISRRDIIRRYNELPIKYRKDICITVKDICTLLHKKEGPFLKDIQKDLETKIVNRELVNDAQVLKEYIVRTY